MTVVVDSVSVQARRNQIKSAAEALLYGAQSQGREQLSPAELIRYNAMVDDLRDLDSEVERRSQASATITNLSARLGGQYGGARVMDQDLTYRRRRTRLVGQRLRAVADRLRQLRGVPPPVGAARR